MTTQINGDTGVSQCQPNSVSQDDLQSGVVGKGPAFSAYASADTPIAQNVGTKINFQTEQFDTANAFSSIRFQPTVAGYYLIFGGARLSTTATQFRLYLVVSGVDGKNIGYTENGGRAFGGCIQYLNGTTDYVELWAAQSAAPQNIFASALDTYFQGALVRAA